MQDIEVLSFRGVCFINVTVKYIIDVSIVAKRFYGVLLNQFTLPIITTHSFREVHLFFIYLINRFECIGLFISRLKEIHIL